jgi:hypothetical protein
MRRFGNQNQPNKANHSLWHNSPNILRARTREHGVSSIWTKKIWAFWSRSSRSTSVILLHKGSPKCENQNWYCLTNISSNTWKTQAKRQETLYRWHNRLCLCKEQEATQQWACLWERPNRAQAAQTLAEWKLTSGWDWRPEKLWERKNYRQPSASRGKRRT